MLTSSSFSSEGRIQLLNINQWWSSICSAFCCFFQWHSEMTTHFHTVNYENVGGMVWAASTKLWVEEKPTEWHKTPKRNRKQHKWSNADIAIKCIDHCGETSEVISISSFLGILTYLTDEMWHWSSILKSLKNAKKKLSNQVAGCFYKKTFHILFVIHIYISTSILAHWTYSTLIFYSVTFCMLYRL